MDIFPDETTKDGQVSFDNHVSGTNLIYSIVQGAIEKKASDVHIEPFGQNGRIQYRIDGVLHDIDTLSAEQLAVVVNSLRVLANLDPVDAVTPEDGHFFYTYDDQGQSAVTVDIRLSIFPVVSGSSVVLRVLDRSEVLLSMKDLGMRDEDLIRFKRLSLRSYGMMLVTGPVGSGKTTTLYSVLLEFSKQKDHKNIITLEDPVEYHFDGIRQSQIQPERGYTFAEGMKSILRQDPDAIMIGEIRDQDTAGYAIEASLAGRAVFSSIHANSTVGTIARLVDMNIERGLIAYAINGAISQRLVKKICQACKTDYAPPLEHLKMLDIEHENIAYKIGAGCEECAHTGYKGRTGIFEILEFNDEIRALIVEKASIQEITEAAEKLGFRSLRDEAVARIREGIITPEEAIKTAY